MREIKFRVWDEIHKQFIPKHFYEITFQLGSDSFGRMLCDWKNYQQEEYLYEPNQRLNQFTGLKDKNGREIYEGDIIRYIPFNYNNELINVECISLQYLHWWSELQDMLTEENKCHIEVIGNIYENPELLENE